MHVLIIGGGIGGLATALSLHKAGISATVFEAVPEIRPLGVGINMLPHATRELTELGLADRLEETGIRTRELIYANRHGQQIWQEDRGLHAVELVLQLIGQFFLGRRRSRSPLA